MSRTRNISPEFWRNQRYARLTDKARLLALALNNHADDEGLLRWTSSLCRQWAFQGRNIQPKRIAGFMQELIAANVVLPYEADMAMLVYFHEEQTINRPQKSKLVPPDPAKPETQRAYYDREHGLCCVCNGQIETEDIASVLVRIMGDSSYPSNFRIAHPECQSGEYPPLRKTTEKRVQKPKEKWHNAYKWISIWNDHYHGILPLNKMKTTCMRLEKTLGDSVFLAWDNYCERTDARFAPSIWKFAETAGAWMPE